MNPNDTQAKFIFATGSGFLKSNSLSTGIRRHSSNGSSSMSLTKVFGKKDVPAGVITSDTSGNVQRSRKTDHDFGPNTPCVRDDPGLLRTYAAWCHSP